MSQIGAFLRIVWADPDPRAGMAVTAETLPHAVAHLREALPGQMNQVETFLTGPF